MNYAEMYERRQAEGRIKDLTPEYVTFNEVDDSLVGRLIGITDVISTLNEGTYNQYLLETDEGMKKFALGNATDKEMINTLIVGGIYAITYKGKEQLKGGRRVNKFSIESIPEFDDETVGGEDDKPF